MKVEWFPYDRDLRPPRTTVPPKLQLLWIRTFSGVVATGWIASDGGQWITDGFRVPDAWDQVMYWAPIEYPEG